jgi:hypothetical protein
MLSPALAQRPTLVSIGHGDVSGGNGGDPVVSANGRYVAFHSGAFNLIPNDDNGRTDIFVRDLQTGTTILVSVNLAGTGPANGNSNNPVISADGRYVAFESTAANLTANDTNTWTDVYVRDLHTGTTTLISKNSAGTGSGTHESFYPVISANGRVVVFKSFAGNLVANDNNNTIDLFAYDLQTGITSLVSSNAAGTGSGNNASFPSNLPKNKAPRNFISNDGRFVVFESNATDLVTISDSNGEGRDVFVRDLQTSTTALVSVNTTGTGSANSSSGQPVISGNARYVFFQSTATNLATNDTGNSLDLFVRDLQTGTTRLVSVTTTNTGSFGPSNQSYFPVVSEDGRFAVFQSDVKNHVANDSNSGYDVFVRDLQANATTLVSVNRSGGTSVGSEAIAPVVSADGRFVAFIGYRADLVATSDNNGGADVYLRDLSLGTTTLLSTNSAGTSSANLGSEYPVISADGRFVFYESSATDMVPNSISGYNIFAVAVNGRAQFEAATQVVNEADGTATISITRSGNTSGAATVRYTTSNGSATAAADYSATSGSLAFADGETSKTITVPILDDEMDEANETVSLTINDFMASGDAAGSLSMMVLTITDNDPPPSISIEDIVVTEGDNGTSSAAITVSLSGPSSKTVRADLSTESGTATYGNYYGGTAAYGDYYFTIGGVNISPGITSQKINVYINGDVTFEDDETFFINLSNPTDVTIADGQGLVTIKNDDLLPAVTIGDVTLPEGNTGTKVFSFPIRLSNPSSKEVTVQLKTLDGMAKAGGDYQAVNGVVTFNPGETFKLSSIIVNGDSLIEADESFIVDISNPLNASIADSQGIGIIRNDDAPVVMTEENTERAVALDSVTQMSGPFSPVNSYNFSSDKRTRISLFVMNLELLPGEDASAVKVQAQDAKGRTYTLQVEYLATLPGFPWLTQAVIKLPDDVFAPGDLRMSISLRGVTSNNVFINLAAP